MSNQSQFTPPCGCTGGPCYWKPDILKVPGFDGMEVYYSHKGTRIRFPQRDGSAYDDYANGLTVQFVNQILKTDKVSNALYEALTYADEQIDLSTPRFKDADDSDTVAIEVTIGWFREVRAALALVGDQSTEVKP